MSSLKKVLLKNTTRMSLNERFTFIRKNEKRTTVAERIVEQQASSKNRRLALQMDRRSQMITNKKPLSRAINVRERLGMPRGVYTTRRRGARAGYVTTVYKSPLLRRRQLGGLVPGGGMMDSGNIGRSNRSRSPFIARRQRARSRSRSVSRARSVSRGRSPSRGYESFGARSRSPFARNYIRGGFRPYRGRNRGGQSFGNFYFRGTSRGGFRGRFRSRGRGRGSRGRGAGGARGGFGGGGLYSRVGRRNAPVPTKEELDKQLDEYMTDTKAVDREGDAYMKSDSWD